MFSETTSGTVGSTVRTGSSAATTSHPSEGTTGTSATSFTRAGTGSTPASSAVTPSITSGTGSTESTLTTGSVTGTTTKRCAEMQAVDEAVSKKITVTPTELPKGENIEFQVTSKRGVSFPKDERQPTMTVHFDRPAQVQSVTIPRDKTPDANVQQFEVTFISPEGKNINDKPIVSNSSPKNDKNSPASLDSTQIPSNTPVSQVVITVLHTTDDQSPKGVVLDIKACTEATATTGLYFHVPFVV